MKFASNMLDYFRGIQCLSVILLIFTIIDCIMFSLIFNPLIIVFLIGGLILGFLSIFLRRIRYGKSLKMITPFYLRFFFISNANNVPTILIIPITIILSLVITIIRNNISINFIYYFDIIAVFVLSFYLISLYIVSGYYIKSHKDEMHTLCMLNEKLTTVIIES